MNANIEVGLAGRYRMTAIRPDGSSRVVADWFENLITNGGMDQLGDDNALSHCQVGAGSSAPSVLNSALDALVASTYTHQDTVQGGIAVSPYYGFTRRTFRFAAGVAAGNLSEVGVGWADSGSLFSRALIVDSEGDPTTITILSDEVLDVTYEVRFYPPLGDAASTISIGGVTYNVTMRAANVGDTYTWSGYGLLSAGADTPSWGGPSMTPYDGPIGAITDGQPTGPSGSVVYGAPQPYIAGTHERLFKFTWGLNDGNIDGGINSFAIRHYLVLGDYQCQLSAHLPKDNTKVLTLDMKMGWARRAA